MFYDMTDGAGGTHIRKSNYILLLSKQKLWISTNIGPYFYFLFFIPLLNFRNFLYDIIN